jgi:hypothetical protein
VESFCESIDKQFGKDAALRPANIIDSKKLEICTPEVKVTVDPKFGYLVQTKVIDGKKYILTYLIAIAYAPRPSPHRPYLPYRRGVALAANELDVINGKAAKVEICHT